MTPEQYQRIREIFLAAAERPREEQAAYLDEACAQDGAIRSEVESLLQHHHRPEPLIDDAHAPGLSGRGALLTGLTSPMDEDASAGSSDSSYFDMGRFTPGTLIANRYRIMGLLGRGGMGEVYRADDLTLAQPVALKFLPPVFSTNPKWLARFHNEVRTARAIAHPNVCRVFDIGEYAGEQFISMEYIDGENLASLLRRIGRLPQDKALQIARQLCAGLAAAHDKGVLHRDLKPANVMIDGRGHVRITDFGLAAPIDVKASGTGSRAGLRAGTPAYMSPEQLAGRDVTVRSDIYALGLVLYEVFTGKQAFTAESFAEYVRLHTTSDPVAPSQHHGHMDSVVETVIMRCLDKEPSRRPRSAMAVAAALPGGDPLAAALAAGETPSPEMVAAAGGHQTMTLPLTVWAVLGVLCGLVAVLLLSAYTSFIPQAQLEKEPAVLAEKAREIITRVGYTTPPRDWTRNFGVDYDFYRHVKEKEPPAKRWDKLVNARPGPIYFLYRQSPDYLIRNPGPPAHLLDLPGTLPPGAVTVRLDPQGRLLEFVAVPKSSGSAATQASDVPPSPAYGRMFEAAGLDIGSFREVPPQVLPPFYADDRRAWEGNLESGTAVRIEAAAVQGRPTYFTIVGPWDQTDMPPTLLGTLASANLTTNITIRALLILGMLASAAVLAWRNISSGRADRNGAMRLAGVFLLVGMLVAAARMHHVPNFLLEFFQFTRALGETLFMTLLVWAFYLALEPYVRRIWPQTIIAWSRLLAGQVTDPLVARHVLIGALAGVACTLLTQVDRLLPSAFGLPSPLPQLLGKVDRLTIPVAGSLLEYFLVGIYASMLLLMMAVVFRVALRKRVAAGIVFVTVVTAATAPWGQGAYFSFIIQALLATIFLTVLVRLGLVAMLVCFAFMFVLADLPLNPALDAWYAPMGLYGLAFLALVVIVAAVFATGRASHGE